jgi:hypothetical protein
MRFLWKYDSKEKCAQKFYNLFKTIAIIYDRNHLDCSELENFLYKLKLDYNLENINQYSSYFNDCIRRIWRPSMKEEALLESELNKSMYITKIECILIRF